MERDADVATGYPIERLSSNEPSSISVTVTGWRAERSVRQESSGGSTYSGASFVEQAVSNNAMEAKEKAVYLISVTYCYDGTNLVYLRLGRFLISSTVL